MILSLETSTSACSVALHDSGQLIGSQFYDIEKSHSSLLPGIIGQLLANTGVSKDELIAVAVSNGPGSYTGLRIGMSTAKGLCMSLHLPLIGINTLDILIEQVKDFSRYDFIMPIIDARRMEVYTKVVSSKKEVVMDMHSLIFDNDSLNQYGQQALVMIGNAVSKAQVLYGEPNISFIGCSPQAADMGQLAYEYFKLEQFADLAYFEPEYIKPFQTKPSKNKLLS